MTKLDLLVIDFDWLDKMKKAGGGFVVQQSQIN